MKNDATAQRTMVYQFSGKLMSVASRYVIDEHEAKDIVQIHGYSYLETYTATGSMMGILKHGSEE